MMKKPENMLSSVSEKPLQCLLHVVFVTISVAALGVTFLLSLTALGFAVKLLIFVAIVGVYLLFCIGFYLIQKRRAENSRQAEVVNPQESGISFTSEIENRLLALEDANEFFGASLKPNDVFRLVASRINELVPFASCVLSVADDEKEFLKIEHTAGRAAQNLKAAIIPVGQGNAGKAFSSRRPRLDTDISYEKIRLDAAAMKNLKSAAAIPLSSGGETFAILQVFGEFETAFDENSLILLEAVGERITPLLLSSMTYQKNLESALTDSLTKLPNERAFFLVLENQVAETQRNSQRRPLAVVTIDLKNFDDLNKRFGHATGDRVLLFAGEVIKSQLRQMDFLARSAGDEFFVALPTATKVITEEVCERIARSFVTKPFDLDGREKVYLSLNFGTAAFGADGETASEMLKTANLRRRQSKRKDADNVLWFPSEIVS